MPAVVGDAGLVVGERDVTAWAAAIDRLLENEALRRAYAASGLERAHTRFAWPVIARAHLAFFEILTGRQPA
jgi:glycosyltransferase involved in cell wall biosynthesis